jgi:hypothetical protein
LLSLLQLPLCVELPVSRVWLALLRQRMGLAPYALTARALPFRDSSAEMAISLTQVTAGYVDIGLVGTHMDVDSEGALLQIGH